MLAISDRRPGRVVHRVFGAWAAFRRSIASRSRREHTVIAIGMIAAVVLLKVEAGRDVGVTAVDLLPIAYTTWFISRRAGLVVAVSSAAALFVANVFVFHTYPSGGVDFWNAAMDMVVFIVLTWSLSETKAQYEHATELARLDPLTGLLNRRAFLDAVALEARRAQRFGSAMTLAYVDLDDFKAVNDTYGHAAGDRCLKATASVLRNVVREVDVVGRLGGDEFAVLLTAMATDAAAVILGDIADAVRRGGGGDSGPKISLSIGAVTFTHPGEDVGAMLREADQLLYLAKRSGSNQLVHEQR